MKVLEETRLSSRTGFSIYHRSFESISSHAGGKVLLLHGLGDHIACLDWAAELLLQAGFSPEGFDWPGHGQSSGKRGDVPGVEAAHQLIDETIARMDSPPVGVFTHSTGGLLILTYLEKKILRGEEFPFEWMWLNSPLLHPEQNQSNLKMKAAKWLENYLPRLTFSTGVTREQCCHMENAGKDDPRINFDGCHNRVSLRYGNSLLDVRRNSSEDFRVPESMRILLSQGDEDPVCPPFLAMDFFNRIKAADKTFILVHGARHEAFREADTNSFYGSARAWLSRC